MNSPQTLESLQHDFDRIALLPDEKWNHTSHYHNLLLSQLPDDCEHILEIGCGTGTFSHLLAQRAAKVLAIDLSPQMIRVARENSARYPNIDFVLSDVLEYPVPANHFDCIATLTTLHHLPLAAVLKKIRQALKPQGVFLCLDLYRRSNANDLFFDGIAYPLSLALRFMKTGRLSPSREMREAYEEHGKTDSYRTLRQVRQTCAEVMPDACVTRHLLWRYSIIWRKPLE
ncbi:MAG TPA: class I SAM-dependent methyltransferase [Pyrinomonadaceae bacterium]|nr:class I SAM-dependent methyltransferase [Pyrinomonadaceae bacterium]